MAQILTSPLPDVTIPDGHLTPFVLRHRDRLSDEAAIIDGVTGRRFSYGEVGEAVARVAGGLAARGFGRGDVLAIMAPNLPEYAVAFHAAATLGGIVTTINPTYTFEEVAFQLHDSGARMLLTIPELAETVRAAVDGTTVSELVSFGESDGMTPFSELMEADSFDGVADVDADDVVALPYSSGTTGLPKGVMLSHRNLAANLAQSQYALPIDEGDGVIAVLPFFHIYGMQVLMNGVLHYGGTVVTLPRFDLERFLATIAEHRIALCYVVPPIVLALAKHPLVDEYDLSSLKIVFSGAAPLGADVAEAAAARVGCQVVQGYGLTETSPVTHATPPGQYRPGSIGVALSNTECRIVDAETGRDVAPGEDGELWIRGPQVMRGYLNNPEATAATIDADGWLHTGDVARVDRDGHYYIVDRLKELIKYKGFQVPPAELEAVLLTHPGIADAAVIPVTDEEAGEVPKAFVVRKAGVEMDEQDVMDHVAGHVAHFKQLRYVEFVQAIPKSASGKILRRLLRDRGASSG